MALKTLHKINRIYLTLRQQKLGKDKESPYLKKGLISLDKENYKLGRFLECQERFIPSLTVIIPVNQ